MKKIAIAIISLLALQFGFFVSSPQAYDISVDNNADENLNVYVHTASMCSDHSRDLRSGEILKVRTMCCYKIIVNTPNRKSIKTDYNCKDLDIVILKQGERISVQEK